MTTIAIDRATDSLSHWHATAEPLVPSGAMPARADVVVVGGGMVGCWTAYWLAKAGVQVVLLERTAIGWGATGRNGGFLVSGTTLGMPALINTVGQEHARNLHQLTLDGQELAFSVIEEEGVWCDLQRVGTLSLLLDQGPDTNQVPNGEVYGGDILDRQQVQDLIGTPLGDRIVGGRYAPGDGVLHSSRYLAGIAHAAERHGATLVRATVSSLTAIGDSTRVETSAGSIAAGRVVIGLNAWTDALVPEVAGKIVPTRGQILAYAPSERVFHSAVGANVSPTGEYWQQTADGSIVIGGCRADAPNRDLDVREMVPTDDVIARIENVLPGLFPELRDLAVARTWAGLMAFTSDYLPVADTVAGLPNTWFAGGFNGHGMTFGPRIGQLLAEAATLGTLPEVLSPLELNRPTLTRLV